MRTLVLAAALVLTATAAEAGDAARGKIAFGKDCAVCHTVIANTRDSMGPGLAGIVGRKAGSKPGFAYSDAMKNAGFAWSHDKLKAYVSNPDGVVPGSNMMFTGDPTQAEDIVAYLETLK